MRHIVIRNLGPIRSADIFLKQYNVIIGPQSSGKSCVLKTICFCTWIEKRIMLSQDFKEFINNDSFLTHLVTFHKLDEYIKNNTYIEYESNYLHFTYDNTCLNGEKLKVDWNNENKWDFKRPKVSYVPAERNLVAVVPNWLSINLPKGNILNFITDWNKARKASPVDIPILDLGVKYHYEDFTERDVVVLNDKKEVSFTNTSSGLHALIPMLVHINHIVNVEPKVTPVSSVEVQETDRRLILALFLHMIRKYKIMPISIEEAKGEIADKKSGQQFIYKDNVYQFNDEISAEYTRVLDNFRNTDHYELFIEEPEENLFPTTQMSLMQWLHETIKGNERNLLFVATHSPYVLRYFMDQKVDFNLFRLKTIDDGDNEVVNLSATEIESLNRAGTFHFMEMEWCETGNDYRVK